MSILKIGTISKLFEDGHGYVKGDNGKEFVFSFGALKNYCGEYAKEYGIEVGSAVIFEVAESTSNGISSKIKKISLIL